MKVKKFGGSSVATPQRIKSIIDILQTEEGYDYTLVFSAFGGVTDQLIKMSAQAVEGNHEYRSTLNQLEVRHLDAVRSLLSVQMQNPVLARVKILLNELENVLQGVFLLREQTLRTLDYIMSFGERLSAYIISQALNHHGIATEFLDARNVIRTNSHFGYAAVDFAVTNQLIQKHFAEARNVQVITGFIGSDQKGNTTTLGRSGSDYTAAIFAAALQASDLEIWTDVDGMMTADPRKVTKAFSVPEMTYQEAMELSHFGAKVIFPATMQPAMIQAIPILIKNTFNPTHAGTIISHTPKPKHEQGIIKGISSVDNISLLNIQGSGLLGVVGVSMRLFRALAQAKINVILISQASSEHSICLAVDSAHAHLAKQSIESEFAFELQTHGMDEVLLEDNLAVIAIVGEGMKQNPGTSGRMFHALGKNGINIRAIAQGSSELNISAVVRQTDTAKALNVLHEAFFLSDNRTLSLFMVGTGLIGKSLIEMIKAQSYVLNTNHHLEVVINGLANSRQMLLSSTNKSISKADLDERGESMRMTSFVEQMITLNLPNSIFIDCTSSEEVTDFYQVILSANISIVTPNKKANTGSLSKYKTLRQASARRGVKFLYETNVGAGLPVISTLNDLLLSGDRIIRIEAVLSGTMNFIFSSFGEGDSFSRIVAEARLKGYTEPDPRDDLNGMDVARKLLILARECGMDMEIGQIEVESIVPPDCRGIEKVDEFMEVFQKYDSEFTARQMDAAKRNERLRYMAVLEEGKAKVQLTSVGQSHPFYSLAGSDNIILLTTERYHERPMVIRGPGAGASVTAAGVFADIIRIGNYV
jgi:bifunctional aspartokinase / homoserine dehydrogenase 1